MTQFTEGQQVKLKDEVARQLENTIGTWDNEFKGLVGLVGMLEKPKFPKGVFSSWEWYFYSEDKGFGVSENEIEPVQP